MFTRILVPIIMTLEKWSHYVSFVETELDVKGALLYIEMNSIKMKSMGLRKHP